MGTLEEGSPDSRPEYEDEAKPVRKMTQRVKRSLDKH